MGWTWEWSYPLLTSGPVPGRSKRETSMFRVPGFSYGMFQGSIPPVHGFTVHGFTENGSRLLQCLSCHPEFRVTWERESRWRLWSPDFGGLFRFVFAWTCSFRKHSPPMVHPACGPFAGLTGSPAACFLHSRPGCRDTAPCRFRMAFPFPFRRHNTLPADFRLSPRSHSTFHKSAFSPLPRPCTLHRESFHRDGAFSPVRFLNRVAGTGDEPAPGFRYGASGRLPCFLHVICFRRACPADVSCSQDAFPGSRI